jgi:hypothetical protein
LNFSLEKTYCSSSQMQPLSFALISIIIETHTHFQLLAKLLSKWKRENDADERLTMLALEKNLD